MTTVLVDDHGRIPVAHSFTSFAPATVGLVGIRPAQIPRNVFALPVVGEMLQQPIRVAGLVDPQGFTGVESVPGQPRIYVNRMVWAV